MALHSRPAINIISLCTGGYGLDFGVELAMPAARSVVLVEREAFAVSRLVSAIAEGVIPPAAIWSDARTFDGRPWRGLVDGVIGGIPCQPHSLAGRRRGADDPRDLWSTARRIIVQSGAWWCLIENVPGMLSAKGKIAGAERVWRDLQRLGYTVEGGLFSAAEVGASHERERLFILGVADASRARPEGSERRGSSDKRDGTVAPRSASELCGASLVDAEGGAQRTGLCAAGYGQAEQQSGDGCSSLVDASGIGRGEGRTEPELWRGRGSSAVNGGELDVSTCLDGNLAAPEERIEEADDRWAGDDVVNADVSARRSETGDTVHEAGKGPDGERTEQSGRSGISLFPPQPGDADGWRATLDRAPQLEPAICRVADGVASRVDQLRMLGNGVVPLAAAHAVRTLVARLAARGSAGADVLVRMMEAVE